VFARRPDPPKELTAEQAHEWRTIVAERPPEWFPFETHALLAQYCRLTVSARYVGAQVDASEAAQRTGQPYNVRAYRDLLRTAQNLAAQLGVLSTKMRLNQASTKRQDTGASKGKVLKPLPWETESE
jgi:hypothetical protein